jgi:hypothetical protein
MSELARKVWIALKVVFYVVAGAIVFYIGNRVGSGEFLR